MLEILHFEANFCHDVFILLMLFVAGFVASIVNMLSGGGSMIVLGLMILMGIDPGVANGTNRIGVLISTASGAAAFKSENYTEIKTSLALGLWSIPGAILGALVSVKISAEAFEQLLAVVMILIVATMFIPKGSKDKGSAPFNGRLLYPSMLLVGFYGGALQVGVGFLIFGALRHLGNMELMRVNMHRVFIVLIFVIPVTAVFILSGKVNWMYAVALCIGSGIGSWMTVKFALKKGERVIKWGLVASTILMSGKFLFF